MCSKMLADRAFGRLKERIEVDTGPYGDLTEEQMRKRMAELEEKIAAARIEPVMLPPISDDTKKPN